MRALPCGEFEESKKRKIMSVELINMVEYHARSKNFSYFFCF